VGLRPKQGDFTVAGRKCQEKCALSAVLDKFRVVAKLVGKKPLATESIEPIEEKISQISVDSVA
jgi:hypothetical protein